jgi:BASS family bile acid:Na+ symporter
MDATQAFLSLVIVAIMLAMGFELVLDDFRRLLREPRGAIAGLVGQLVFLPLLAFALAFALDVRSETAIGLVLIAACPGGAHSNLYASLARGDAALSVSLTAVSGLVAIVTLPILVGLGAVVFGGERLGIVVPVLPAMAQVFVVMALPVALGMVVRARRPSLATRLGPWLKGFAILLLVLVIAGSIAKQGGALGGFVRESGVPVVALNVGAMLLALVLSRLARVSRAQTITVVLEVGIQNATLAVGIALGMLRSLPLAVPAILYSLLVYASGAVVIAWGRRAVADSSRTG